MNDHEEHKLDEMVAALPSWDLDDRAAERIRQAAHRALERGAPSTARRRAWFIEPAFALGIAAASLYWVLKPIVQHYQ